MRLLLAVTLCALFVQAPPTAAPFTELERAKLESIAQEGRALDAEQRMLEAEQRVLNLMRERWQAKVADFKAKAEAARPGFSWDADTGKWSEVKK